MKLIKLRTVLTALTVATLAGVVALAIPANGADAQIIATSPLLVLARSLLFQMQFASTQLFQLLVQQTQQHYQPHQNLQQLFAQR